MSAVSATAEELDGAAPAKGPVRMVLAATVAVAGWLLRPAPPVRRLGELVEGDEDDESATNCLCCGCGDAAGKHSGPGSALTLSSSLAR